MSQAQPQNPHESRDPAHCCTPRAQNNTRDIVGALCRATPLCLSKSSGGQYGNGLAACWGLSQEAAAPGRRWGSSKASRKSPQKSLPRRSQPGPLGAEVHSGPSGAGLLWVHMHPCSSGEGHCGAWTGGAD